MHLGLKVIITTAVLIACDAKTPKSTWGTWDNEPEIAETIDEVKCVSRCVLSVVSRYIGKHGNATPDQTPMLIN